MKQLLNERRLVDASVLGELAYARLRFRSYPTGDIGISSHAYDGALLAAASKPKYLPISPQYFTKFPDPFP